MKIEKLYMKRIGASIKQHRLSKNLKQEYIGERVNLSKSEISRIENGKRNVGIAKLLEIAKVIEMTASDIFIE